MEQEYVPLTIYPLQKTIQVKKGSTIVDALNSHGIILHTPCGGKGICKKCTVKAVGVLSQPDDFEKYLSDSTLRLACRTTIQGPAEVFITPFYEHLHYPSLNPTSIYGVAIDLGTTSLHIAFIDLISGKIFPEITLLNPQRKYGHDVISRISFAQSTDHARELTDSITTTITSVLLSVCEYSHVSKDRIKTIALSANTTMIYSFLGLDITPLGVYPYTAIVQTFEDYRHYEPIKKFFHDAELIVLPIVSAFLGGDFLGGIGILPQHKGNCFFFDIGTNGEMAVIKQDGSIIATSCAMGPALEGMNITHGMTATEGAITHFFLTHDGKLSYSAIGSPVGISGTALIDILAILLRTGVIDTRGTITQLIPPELQNQLSVEIKDGVKIIRILDTVIISQHDIRNVQLAKAASYAASCILLNEAQLTADDIHNVYIAGAFGTNVNLENFLRLQFLPYFPKAQYHLIGNSSLLAAIETVRNSQFISRIIALKPAIKVIDLSLHKEFNNVFIQSFNF